MASQFGPLQDLIRDVKLAIQNAQLRTPDIIVTKAELEIKTTLSGGPGIEGKIGPVEISGQYSKSQIQTLSLVLVPKPSAIELMGPRTDSLTDAIALISSAAREAAASEPRFALNEATVELNFAVDKSGKAMFIVGADISTTNTHTLVLTLQNKT